VVKTIASTCTRTGLRVQAQLDTATYPIGVSVSMARVHALPIAPHSWCGSWNYTLHPANESTADPAAAQNTDNADPAHTRAQGLEVLSDPLLTGMTRMNWPHSWPLRRPLRACWQMITLLVDRAWRLGCGVVPIWDGVVRRILCGLVFGS
jgi:hypothetical protein